MNAPADLIRLTQFSHGGGCGCKIAPAVLSEILAKTPIRGLPKDLLVGIESSDDAAVYRLNDEQAIVATTDFFTPIVDDAYDFGRVAATNALSDIYAMGARPVMCLNLVAWPREGLPFDLGIISTALKRDQAPPALIAEAVRLMTTLNEGARDAALEVGVNAATDV